jgi:hypothetical protein
VLFCAKLWKNGISRYPQRVVALRLPGLETVPNPQYEVRRARTVEMLTELKAEEH